MNTINFGCSYFSTKIKQVYKLSLVPSFFSIVWVEALTFTNIYSIPDNDGLKFLTNFFFNGGFWLIFDQLTNSMMEHHSCNIICLTFIWYKTYYSSNYPKKTAIALTPSASKTYLELIGLRLRKRVLLYYYINSFCYLNISNFSPISTP